MTTRIRPEVSKRNKYWIPKHRYYELKHFCLQYPEWKKELRDAAWFSGSGIGDSEWSDPTGKTAEKYEILSELVRKIERCSELADDQISSWLLKAVTENLSYVNLSMVYNIPCGKDLYYDRYRRFFWLLDRFRD